RNWRRHPMPVLVAPRGRLELWPMFPLDVRSGPPRDPRYGLLFLVVLLLATLVIVAHGCHPGDHDDEPAWYRFPPRSSKRIRPDTVPEAPELTVFSALPRGPDSGRYGTDRGRRC